MKMSKLSTNKFNCSEPALRFLNSTLCPDEETEAIKTLTIDLGDKRYNR